MFVHITCGIIGSTKHGGSVVSIEDFKKFEFKVSTIKDAQDHPNADKLYILKVDIGGQERQLVAGIRPFYKKEDLVGKQVVVIVNLQPAVIRGVESQGMLLAAQDQDGISVVSPDRFVKEGSGIR